jgi:hypothetical protein
MMRDAESHAEEDKRRKEEADVRNNADNLVYSVERSLKDVDGKVDPNTKLEIEQAIKEAKEALAGGDVEEIKTKQEALVTASHKLSEALYSQVQDQQQSPPSPPTPKTWSRTPRSWRTRTTSRTGSAAKLAGEEERRDPNLPGDAEPEGEPIEEVQGSPSDPDIVDETGAVDESDDVPEEAPVEAMAEEALVPLAEFEAVSAERDQYLDSLRRLKAEFDNSRKRQERERA